MRGFSWESESIWHFPFPQRLEEYRKRCLCNQWKYVQSRQQSQGVKDAERQLYQVVELEISENDKRWNRSGIQGWLNLMPHCPLLLELWLELPQLKKCMAKFNLKINFPSSFIEQRLYLAISCRAKVNEETRPKYIKPEEGGSEGGREQEMSPQPAKIRTTLPTKSGSRISRAAALSGR